MELDFGTLQTPVPVRVHPLLQACGMTKWFEGNVIVEIAAPPGTGKTQTVFELIAEVQAADGNVIYIDADHKLQANLVHAIHAGVHPDELLVIQSSSAWQIWELLDLLIPSGVFDLVVIDSMPMLDFGDGTLTAGWNKFLGKLSRVIGGTPTSVVLVNQLRCRIGSKQEELVSFVDAVLDAFTDIRILGGWVEREITNFVVNRNTVTSERRAFEINLRPDPGSRYESARQ